MYDQLKKYTQDAIMYYSSQLFEGAKDPASRQEALNQTCGWLSLIPQDLMREEYIAQIAKDQKIKKQLFIDKVNDIFQQAVQEETKATSKDAQKWQLPDGVDQDEVLRWGFYGLIDGGNTGYYFQTSAQGGFVSVSNFVITPLFHKPETDDNTRIIKIDNGIMAPEIAEMPSQALISVEQFRKFLFDKGPYFFDGSKQQLDKLNKRYLFDFPKAYELKTLGWQNEGFFAYYNYCYNGKLESYNEAGIVKQGDHYFFSPAISSIYKDQRKEDDMYENDRYLEYVTAPINFSKWASLMVSVYGEHAWAGVPFALVTLFRDIVFKVDNNCPFLYCYGQSKSGKSKFTESISNLFFRQMPAFNLNSGTDFAFAQRMQRFRNCPIRFNEFDDGSVRDEWFQAIKGAYDGEGRERGKGGSKRKTEMQRINGTLILAGQFLCTKDDNSVVSRSIIRSFKVIENRPESQVLAYEELKQLEDKGLSSIITDLLHDREMVAKQYYEEFHKIMKGLASSIRKKGKQYDERVLRNFTSLATMVSLFGGKVQWPWRVDEYIKWCEQEIINLTTMIASSDILVDFWETVETLVGEPMGVREGVHYRMEELSSVRITVDKTDETKLFDSPKKVLFIRMKQVQQLYSRFKRQTGAHPIDFTSLISYVKNKDYYIGSCNSYQFYTDRKMDDGTLERKAIKTSCFLFDLDLLDIGGLYAEKSYIPAKVSSEQSSNEHSESMGQLNDDKEEDLPF